MKKAIILLLSACMLTLIAHAQERIPRVYDQENTGAHYTAPAMPSASELPPVYTLRDPLQWCDGSGRALQFCDWERRRSEIAAEIQHYEIGTKPSVIPGEVKARMDGDTLIVDVTHRGETLTLKSHIQYPKTGKAPFPILIGTSMISLPRPLLADMPIAMMTFHEKQVNDYGQWGKHHERGEHDFDRLYPELKDNGAYSEWAWGLSRLIDGLQLLGEEVTRIDTRHIGVTGCSYAGKMALFCGAFDERVALTIAQEPGGGGAAAWRVSNMLDSVESLDRTDYHWFKESMRTDFAEEKTFRLPHDRHELCAMVCPRALLMLGNPDYKWLADESAYVSMEAASKVWQQYGIADRVGYSIVSGHPHCRLHESQYPEVKAFISRFLLEEDVSTEGVAIAPDFKGKTDLSKWIRETPGASWESAHQSVDNMKIGWNLGNTLDATGKRDTISITPTDFETSWRQPVTTRAMIHAFKERGFNCIRIPVTWEKHLDSNGNIDPAWLRRVGQIVNYVMDEGMYCIINVHHDTGTHGWLNADPARYPEISKRVKKLWQQIAERFESYGERLLFEGYNEMLDKDGHWNSTTPENYEAANALAQDFVDAVRGTGGNNEWRNLIVTTYSANGGKTTLGAYRLPKDLHEHHLIGEVHFYDPQEFCFPEHKPAVYTKKYQKISRKVINRVADHFDRLGVPVIIGEIAAFDKNNTPERVKFARLVSSECKRRGITLVWWMGLLDRASVSWSEPEIVDALMEGVK